MAGSKLGTVTHYYDKLGVAIIDLTSGLKAGDKIRFERGGEELFTQSVDSMQLEHESVTSAKKGDSVGVKVDEKVKEQAEVFKV